MSEINDKFDLILTILEQIQEKLHFLSVKIFSSEEKGSEVRSAAHTEEDLEGERVHVGPDFPRAVIPSKLNGKVVEIMTEKLSKEDWKTVKYDCRVLKHTDKAVNVLMDDKQQWFPKGWIVNLEMIDLEEMDNYQTFQFRWFGIVKKGLEGLFNE